MSVPSVASRRSYHSSPGTSTHSGSRSRSGSGSSTKRRDKALWRLPDHVSSRRAMAERQLGPDERFPHGVEVMLVAGSKVAFQAMRRFLQAPVIRTLHGTRARIGNVEVVLIRVSSGPYEVQRACERWFPGMVIGFGAALALSSTFHGDYGDVLLAERTLPVTVERFAARTAPMLSHRAGKAALKVFSTQPEAVAQWSKTFCLGDGRSVKMTSGALVTGGCSDDALLSAMAASSGAVGAEIGFSGVCKGAERAGVREWLMLHAMVPDRSSSPVRFACSASASLVAAVLGEADPQTLPKNMNSNRVCNIPEANTNFTGRLGEIQLMERLVLQEKRQVILAGLGGIGKTATAIEFAWHLQRSMTFAVMWLLPCSPDRVRHESLLALAHALGILGNAGAWQPAYMHELAAALTRVQGPSLILADACAGRDTICSLAPLDELANVTLLYTSRDSALSKAMRLPPLSSTEAAELLHREAGASMDASDDKALELAQQLGCLPLALRQAAAMMREQRIGADDYLIRLNVEMRKLMRDHRPADYPTTLVQTWLPDLAQQPPAAQQLFRLCAFLHSEKIPDSFVMSIAAEPMVRSLYRCSLIAVDAQERNKININPMLQWVVRDSMLQHEYRHVLGQAVARVRTVIAPFAYNNPQTWDIGRDYVLHMEAVCRRAWQSLVDLTRVNFLVDAVAKYYQFVTGQYERSLVWRKIGVEVAERAHGAESRGYAVAQNELAHLYRVSGQFREALAAIDKAVDVSHRLDELAGSISETYCTTVRNRSDILFMLRKHDEAEAGYKLVMELEQSVYGDANVIDRAITLSNLANVYRETGLFDKAVPLYEEALKVYKASLGTTEHPEVANTMRNLAVAYRRQDSSQHARALELHEQSIAIFADVAGTSHPTYARMVVEHGIALCEMKRRQESLRTLKRGYHLCVANLGANSADAANARSWYLYAGGKASELS